MELPAYHPFRSAKAKEQYLALYDLRAKQWPIPSETRMVETSYGQTFVRLSGPADAQPLVLLPGFQANSLLWIPNIAALSACYKTCAVDNIYDIGRSIYIRPLKTPGDYVNWLDELFTALALREPIHLMGISYGGWLTCQYALRYPQRLGKIVLLAPAAVLPLRLEFMMRGLLGLVHPRFFRDFFQWVLESGLYHEEAHSQRLMEESIDDMLLALRCFRLKAEGPPKVLADNELQRLRVPALYLVGEHEKIYPAQKAVQRLNRVAPWITTKIVPRAGHGLNATQAELVNKKVLDFLKQP